MRIVFSGLTAAGKTTHSQLLAEELGADWFGASELLAQLAGFEEETVHGLWLRRGAEIEAQREGDALDRELDRRLALRLSSSAHVVGDAWALPWLTRVPAVRVWLESDLHSRCLKCMASQLPSDPVTYERAREVVVAKDTSTRERFARMYGFDLFTDHDRFDVVMDNSQYIAEPTLEAAQKGIAAFAPVLRAAVHMVAGTGTDADKETIRSAPDGVLRRAQPAA